MNGFYERLRDEVVRLMNSSQYAENLGTMRSVKFYRLPNTSIEIYNSWMGGKFHHNCYFVVQPVPSRLGALLVII